MSITRVLWTTNEDNLCMQAVNSYLVENGLLKSKTLNFSFITEVRVKWQQISNVVGTRSAKQCRERYLNHLRPGIRTSEWTKEEDNKLRQYVLLFSKSWKKIEQLMDGRPENSLKMRWRQLERRKRQMLKRKLRMASILKEQIRLRNMQKASNVNEQNFSRRMASVVENMVSVVEIGSRNYSSNQLESPAVELNIKDLVFE